MRENRHFNEQPFAYCRFVATYPTTSFLLTLSGHVTLAVVTLVLFVRGYDIFPTDFQNIPLELYDIPYKSRSYAWLFKDDFHNINIRLLRDPSYNNYRARMIENNEYKLHLVYESKEGNIFSKQNLQNIQQIETDLISSKIFSKVCATRDPKLRCKDIQSIIKFFDGTYVHINPIFNDTNFENVNAVLYEASYNKYTKDLFKYYLPETYTLTSSATRASFTRSKVSPVVSSEEEKKYFLKTEVKPKLIYWKHSFKQFNMFYFSWFYFKDELVNQTLNDAYFAGGSCFFIFCFMIFHTRSLWVTFWAVFSMCTSYLGSNIIYRCIIGYQYFGYLHIVAMFIILGIGADDLFVFYDTWQLTSSSVYVSLAHRLSDAYAKSMFSMLITSLTTAVAFFVSAASPFLCTKSFGIFSGILVIINYISVIIFFPTVVIFYHVKFESCSWQCYCCRRKKNLSPAGIHNNGFESDMSSEDTVEEKFNLPSRSQSSVGHNISRRTSVSNDNPKIENSFQDVYPVSLENIEATDLTKRLPTYRSDRIKRKIYYGKANKKQSFSRKIASVFSKPPAYTTVLFIRDYYFRFITDKHMRYRILLFFAYITIVFSYQAASLTPDRDQFQTYKDGHNFAKARQMLNHGFQEVRDRYIDIYIVWGIKERDRSSCNFTSVICKGEQVYDDEFDPNPPENQIALKMFCDRLYNLSDSEISELKIRKKFNGDLEISCFARNMDQYLKRTLSKEQALPWNYGQTMKFMEAFPQYYSGRFNKSFTDYFDIPLQFWLLNGNTLKHSTDFTSFNALIGEQKTTFSKKPVFDFPTHYGNKIKYLAIRIGTTIDQYDQTYTEGVPIIERWEAFVNNMMKQMPKGLRNGFQLTTRHWDWMYIQQEMANNALFGVVLGVILTFPIITITTMNIIIGLFATVTICCTTVCVIGAVTLAGWKLGLIMSINMCIVVGLSVDYVVHLAEGYQLSKHKDRLLRTRDMLETMGSPVISGAISTLGSTLFLFFCQIEFALQFGVFIFCNIGFSLLFSLGLFSTVMGLFGPENDTGSLTKVFRCCLSYLRKRK